ncbi:MAG: hypothetical protein V4591_00180 [Bdellovibrionota bacterium]
MYNLKYVTIAAIFIATHRIYAFENYTSFITSSNSLATTQFNSEEKNSDPSIPVDENKPGSNYDKLIDEQYRFKELLGIYVRVKDRVEHPVQFEHTFLSSGVVLNVGPAIAMDDGIANMNNMKFMVQVSAHFL